MLKLPSTQYETVKTFDTNRPLVFIDFEFSTRLTDTYLPRLICVSYSIGCSTTVNNIWLLDGSSVDVVRELQELVNTHTLVAHFAIAELLCLDAMGICLDNVQVIDTHAEWSQLANQFTKYNWGKQLQKGKIVNTRPPVDKEEKSRLKELSDAGKIAQQNFGSAEKGLASFVFKMTGVVVDTAHKKEMQQLCIDYNREELERHKQTVMEYCESDVNYLRRAYYSMLQDREAKKILQRKEVMLERGHFTSYLHLLLYKQGLPVDRQALMNLSECTDVITQEIKEQLNEDTGLEFYRGSNVLKLNRKGQYTKTSLARVGTEDQGVIQDYIGSKYTDWPLTEKDKYSTEANVLELYRFDPIIESYYQARKSLRSIQALAAHKSDGTKKDSYLLDNIDPEGNLRCFFGTFGTQTGRNAPRASVFMLAMSKWLRSFLTPPKGYAIVECDYSSQESLLAGIIYQDKNVIESYKSGDPYLSFGKLAGLVPADYDRKTTEQKLPGLRQKLKAIVLGKSYGMGVKALGLNLAAQTWKGASSPENFSKEWTAHIENSMEDAQELNQAYAEAYEDMDESRQEVWNEFKDDGSLQISRDWCIGDQVFALSLLNSPVQGLGARIMRTFTHFLLTDECPYGVKMFAPLHDAAFCLVPIDQLKQGCVWIKEKMLAATTREVAHPAAKDMRVGFTIICPELKGQEVDIDDSTIEVQEYLLETSNCKEIRERLKPYWSISSADW